MNYRYYKSWFIILCALLPTDLFWVLNRNVLKTERLYRKLYDIVRKKDEKDIDFSMDITHITIESKPFNTVNAFYLPIMIALLIISCWLYFS